MYIIVGRRAGKSIIGATVAAYEAAFPTVTAATPLYALMVAQDQRASLRTLLDYARAPFQRSPALKKVVLNETTETTTLSSGITLAAYPCRPTALRGLGAVVNVVDELAFLRSSEGNPVDVEMLRAVRPTLWTTHGKLIATSTAYAQSGALYDVYRKSYGVTDDATLVIQASAPQLNPTLPTDYLTRMEKDDPEAYRNEVLGEFKTGISTFLDPDALSACVVSGIREVPPVDGIKYTAFCDPSSGTGKDSFTLAIAHMVDGVAQLDCLRVWKPPFNPSGAVAEAAETIKSYWLRAVTGDKYARGFVLEGFAGNGITYHASDRDTSTIYLDVLPLVNGQKVMLLDDADLLREARGLERRRGSSGRDTVSHRANEHDDRINATAGAVTLAYSGAAHRSQMVVKAVSQSTNPAHHAESRLERFDGAIHPHERIEGAGIGWRYSSWGQS